MDKNLFYEVFHSQISLVFHNEVVNMPTAVLQQTQRRTGHEWSSGMRNFWTMQSGMTSQCERVVHYPFYAL